MMQISGSIEESADKHAETDELLHNMTLSVTYDCEQSINNLSSSWFFFSSALWSSELFLVRFSKFLFVKIW